jgi:anti-sigma factor RsiW
MTDARRMTNEELQGYIDGQLEAARRVEIDAQIEADPGLAEKAALFRADKLRLAKIYGGLADRPLPAHWLARIEEPIPARPPVNWRLAVSGIAAALVAFVLVAGAFFIRPISETRGDTIIAEAIAARNDSLPVKETIAVGLRSNGAAADRILASTLAMRAKAPDLGKYGYSLSAIRIYSHVPTGSAIELVYRGKNNDLLSLYVRHAAGEIGFKVIEKDGLHVCLWQDEVVGMVMTGTMSDALMQRLAGKAYSDLLT